jgi:hypothetical protein
LLRLSTPLGSIAKPPPAKNAVYVDFSLVAGEAHNYYTGHTVLEKDNAHVYEFYDTIFHGKAANINDSLVFSKKGKGLGYFIF